MRAKRIIPGTVVIGTVVAALLGFHLWTTHAANRTWTGSGFPNNLWSNSSNWSTNVAPVAGDTLTFGGSISPVSQNNLPNFTTFSSLTINGGHVVQGASIALNTGITASNGHIQLTSIKLNNGQIFFAPVSGVSADISSAIDTNGHFLSLRGPGNLVLTGSIGGSGNLLKLDSGTVHLSGANSYTGGTSISDGTLVVLGSHPAGEMNVTSLGTLGGTGTVGPISTTADADLKGGKISPGNVNQSGVLNVNGNVTFSPNGQTGLDIGMNGAAIGSGYDQLNVTGLVNLGAASLNLSLGFTPSPGATFIIINNDGTDPVTGTFLNHPEGSSFIVNNTTFFISYQGGNGNDVVLHVGQTKTWDGSGANDLWTTGANWSGNTAPQVGDDLVFPLGAARLTSNNDLPANTTFKSITISGIGYTLNGNALNLISTFTSPTSGSFNTVNLAIGGTCSLTSSANLILTGNNTYTGPTTINAGLLTINGNQPVSSVTLNGGALDGLGTVGSITASAGSAVRPGLFSPSSAGTLNASGNVSFSAGSSFSALVTFGSNGNPQTAQLNVTGAVLINSSAHWQIGIGTGPFPSGVDLVMINNDGSDPIVGSFSNFPEGSVIDTSSGRLGITYRGGDGNDFALHVPTIRTWDGGGANNNWTQAANWVGDIAPSAGDDLIFPADAARLTNSNDFPPNTTFNSITFLGVGYVLNGNPITLIAGINDIGAPGTNANALTLPITLHANQTFSNNKPGGGRLFIAGDINTNGRLLTIDGTASRTFQGLISGTGGAGGLNITGASITDLLANNTYTGPTTVSSGVLRIEGSQPSSAVFINGGLLIGSGTTGRITQTGGQITPGGSSGPILTTAGVNLNSGTFETSVQGNSSNRLFGKLNVNGSVNLGNETLRVTPTPPLPPGNTFLIINNDGTDPVNGTFAGLPEGSVITADGRQFRISYTGGDGNDVTLTLFGASVQFSASTISADEGASRVDVTITRTVDTSGVSAVGLTTFDLTGSLSCSVKNGAASSRCDYEPVFRVINFAAGETSKTVPVLLIDDSYLEGPETLGVVLSNPTGAVLGATSVATITISDNDIADGPNPIDGAAFFVRQHYLDFFTREPDPDGLAFWTNDISSCGGDQQCIELKRINVSAAFYLSIEFQQTGYLVERIYKASYGDAMGSSTLGGSHSISVPIIRLNEFLPDTQQIGFGVVVGPLGWEQVLENNKVAFTNDFVQRARFASAFPLSMTAAQFVDQLNLNAGNPLSTSERDQLVAELIAGTKTRAQALRSVAEDEDLVSAEFNRAFVLMQFFGYLRRNPDDAPDSNHTGYDFWLTKLNQFGGNFFEAEMVKAFIDSLEYRKRFAP